VEYGRLVRKAIGVPYAVTAPNVAQAMTYALAMRANPGEVPTAASEQIAASVIRTMAHCLGRGDLDGLFIGRPGHDVDAVAAVVAGRTGDVPPGDEELLLRLARAAVDAVAEYVRLHPFED
jgi:hypothetical protein